MTICGENYGAFSEARARAICGKSIIKPQKWPYFYMWGLQVFRPPEKTTAKKKVAWNSLLYSKIPPEQVIAHIHAVVPLPAMFLTFSPLPLTLPSESSTLLRLLPLLIMIIHALLLLAPHQRDQAWKIHPYPCVGGFRFRFGFLDLSISLNPLYPTVLARLRASSTPQRLLDLGCCFGQDIRRLVANGADLHCYKVLKVSDNVLLHCLNVIVNNRIFNYIAERILSFSKHL